MHSQVVSAFHSYPDAARHADSAPDSRETSAGNALRRRSWGARILERQAMRVGANQRRLSCPHLPTSMPFPAHSQGSDGPWVAQLRMTMQEIFRNEVRIYE